MYDGKVGVNIWTQIFAVCTEQLLLKAHRELALV